ncbi:MAG: putative 5-methyltetrahydropteroyltriglutamate-homocysteine methyltransferase [Ramlibacter sp.]|uniref:cobalamin-independent methionine synthase II family protein n=1 Tax=Ramlibacter sp. TaxID=1917967 RepID=UPI0026358A25|nr:cobalamin-independent methionine synthase II family protein [Ramlibacter sp.]MDB5751043.1 putative 5-methyltetrahydropteroyltriglutamate-homocysteine methyltransferase [Ramlibacter sp.]
MLFPTTIVGSFPQPEWLIDRARLAGRFPSRVRARELWRLQEPYLAQAQDDATLPATKLQQEAGLDVVSDGEIRRESYSNRFATALDGVDLDNPGTGLDRSDHPNPVPRIVGKIRRRHAVQVEDLKFLKRHTTRMTKITVPGPFTMRQLAQNDFYASEEEAAMDYADAVNAETRDLFAAGADVVQIDEPYRQARPVKARQQYGLAALNRALAGVQGTTAVHICFGYAAIIHERPTATRSCRSWLAAAAARFASRRRSRTWTRGCCASWATSRCGRLHRPVGHEHRDAAAGGQRVRRALEHSAPEQVILAPDCGMKYLPREVAQGRLRTMVLAAQQLRQQHAAR